MLFATRMIQLGSNSLKERHRVIRTFAQVHRLPTVFIFGGIRDA